MSLRKQLFISLCASMLLLLCISTGISLSHMQNYFQGQMSEHTQDAATLLADSLSKTDTQSPRAIETLLSTVFEQHRYDAIVYRTNTNQTLFDRQQPPRTLSAPTWFIRLLPLDAPIATSSIMAGNSLQGTIQVRGSTDTAYENLWQAFCKQLAFFSVACLSLMLLCHIALHVVLQPLRRLQEQAVAICERKFIEQQPLPKTKELRQVVEAINRMSRRLKTLFLEQLALAEDLRSQSYMDQATGLSNRRSFDAHMRALAESEVDSNGCLLILQLNDFGLYNLKHGHDVGDECLRAIAAQLQALTQNIPDAIVSRRTGADFAVYLPRFTTDGVKVLANRLMASISNLALLFGHQIHIGITYCSSLRTDQTLLARADTALRQAQSNPHSNWRSYHHEGEIDAAHEARQWYTALNRILQDHSILLHFQPMFWRENRRLMGVETFSRISIKEKIIYAGIFMPMAERFDIAEAFDRLVIDEVRKSSLAANCKVPVCINISSRSVITRSFVDWLDTYLTEFSAFAQQLILETAEHLVNSGYEHVSYLCDVLHRHGAKLSLDHFGLHSAAFGYLNSLQLDFIKIDNSFIRNIHTNIDHQFYVRSLIQIAHTCDITILAEGVENDLEWDCLMQLGIDGGQGYLLGKPNTDINKSAA